MFYDLFCWSFTSLLKFVHFVGEKITPCAAERLQKTHARQPTHNSPNSAFSTIQSRGVFSTKILGLLWYLYWIHVNSYMYQKVSV